MQTSPHRRITTRGTTSPGRCRESRTGAFVATAFAVAVAACSTTTAPLPGSGVPDAFEFSLGGFGVGSTNVLLRCDTLLVWRMALSGPGATTDTARTVPTDDRWRAFWRASEQAGVHRWRRQYQAEGMVDGTGWTTRIVTGGRVVKSTGNNAYPDHLGREHEMEMTADFQRFLAAVSDLAGQRVGF